MKNILFKTIPVCIFLVYSICLASDHQGLFGAADTGDFPKAKLILDAGADVNSQNEKGLTALHIAVAWNDALKDNAVTGKFEIAELLLQKSADVNSANKDGQTPLHLAAQYGRIDLAKILIEYGADIRARTAKKVTIEAWQVTFPAGSTAAEIAGIVRKQKFVNFVKKVERSEGLFRKACKLYYKGKDD